jgi:predicted MFS family arabinose efflux permease
MRAAFGTIGRRLELALTGQLPEDVRYNLRIDQRALPPQQPRSPGSIWAILGQNRRFAIYLLGFSLYGLGFLMGFRFFAIVQVDRLGLSYTAIGYLGLAQSLFWLIGNMYWGRLVDRYGGLWC